MLVLRHVFIVSFLSLAALGCQNVEESQGSLENQVKVRQGNKFTVTDVIILDPVASPLGTMMMEGTNKSICLIRVRETNQTEDYGNFYLTIGGYKETTAKVNGNPVSVPVCPYTPGGSYSFSDVETLPVWTDNGWDIRMLDARAKEIQEATGDYLMLGSVLAGRGDPGRSFSNRNASGTIWGPDTSSPVAKAMRVAYQSLTAGTENGKPKPRFIVKENAMYWNTGSGEEAVSTFYICNNQSACALRAKNGSLYIRKMVSITPTKQACYIWEFRKGLGNSVNPAEVDNDPRCKD